MKQAADAQKGQGKLFIRFLLPGTSPPAGHLGEEGMAENKEALKPRSAYSVEASASIQLSLSPLVDPFQAHSRQTSGHLAPQASW